MKGSWTWKKFLALFMAVAMVMASGVFVTTQSFKATDDESYEQDDATDTTGIEVEEEEPAEETTEIDASEEQPIEETAEEVTLEYDLNAADATGDVPEKSTLTAGSSVTTANGDGLSREGYTFDGWNTAADGNGTKVKGDESFSVDSSTILYAQWAAASEQTAEAESTESTETAESTETTEASEEETTTATEETETVDTASTEEELTIEEEDALLAEAAKMPAGAFTQTTPAGITVSVSYAEGIFPDGVSLVVADVSEDEALAAVGDKVKDATEAAAVDISFVDAEGNEIEPKDGGKVTVSMTLGTPLMGDTQSLVHIDDEGNAKKVSASKTSNGADFSANDFSIYVLVGNGEESTQDYANRTFDYAIEAYDGLVLAENVVNSKGQYIGGTWAIASGDDVISFAKGAVTKTSTSDEQKTVGIKTSGKAGEGVVTYTYKVSGTKYTDTYTIHVKGYTLRFNLNGGSGTVPEDVSVTMTAGGTVLAQLPSGEGLTRKGFTLVGWTLVPNALTSDRRNGWWDKIYDLDDGNAATTTDMFSIAKGGAEEYTFYAAWAHDTGVSGGIGFFLRDDGTIQTEPASYNSSYYTTVTPGGSYYMQVSDLTQYITLIKTETNLNKVAANVTQKAWNEVYNEINKNHKDLLQKYPGLTTDGEGYYITWYVIKDQGSWHVDGVIRDGNSNKVNLDYLPNCNDYSGQAPVGMQYDKGTEISVEGRNTLVRTGYTFGGWNTEPDGSGFGYQEGSALTLTQDTTLYAQWLPNNDTAYTLLCYDADTGEEISYAKKVRYGTTGNTVEANDDDKTLEGYKFVEDDERNVTEAMIDPDGSTTLKLYFEKGHAIRVTANRTYKVYDGKEVTPEYTLTVDGVETDYETTSDGIKVQIDGRDYTVKGIDLEVTQNGTKVTAKDAGRYDVDLGNADDMTVVNSKGKKANVTVKVESGSIEIDKREVTVTSATEEWTYDGKAHQKEDVTATTSNGDGDAWVSGEEPTYTDFASIKIPGTIDNTFAPKGSDWETYKAEHTNYDITVVYGKLKINADSVKYELILQAKDSSYTYDGKTHKPEKDAYEMVGTNATEHKASFLRKIIGSDGDGLEFTMDGNTYTLAKIKVTGDGGKDVGTYEAKLDVEKAIIKDEDGNDVTDLFHIVNNNGSLTINKKDVTLKSDTLTKEYDGEELVNGDTPLLVEDGWIKGEGADYTFTGSRTVMGTTPNSFTYTVNDKTDENNYNIKTEFGDLIVTNTATAITATITPNSKTVQYDGEIQTVEGFVGQLADGSIPVVASDGKTYYVSEEYASASGTDVTGDEGIKVNVTTGEKGYVVTDSKGNDVTATFNVSVNNNAKLVITKRNVTFTSATLTKTYDGDELANPEGSLILSEEEQSTLAAAKVTMNSNGSITADGLADSDTGAIGYRFTSSRILTGTTNNTFDLTWDDSVAANYDVTNAYGTLNISEADYIVTLTANDYTSVYDGTEQSTDTGFASIAYGDDVREITADENQSGKYTVTVDGKTYTISGIYSDSVGKDAGEYSTKTGTTGSKAVVKDENGDKVSENFTVVLVPGKYTITKKAVEVTSATLSKVYDGTALNNSGRALTYSNGGFTAGDGELIPVFTGSQTLVGESDNSFTYTTTGAIAANYTITPIFGKLKVTTARDEDSVTPKPEVDDGDVVYKTHEGGSFKVGDTVTFIVRATNIYQDERTITLTEQEGVTLAQSVFEGVAGGETIETTATYTVTTEDVENGEFTNVVTAEISGGDRPYEADDTVDEELNSEAEYTIIRYNAETGAEIDRIIHAEGVKVGDKVSVSDEEKVIDGYTFDDENEGNKLEAKVKASTGCELVAYFIPGHNVVITYSGQGGTYDGNTFEVGVPQVTVDGIEAEGEVLDGTTLTYSYGGKTYTLENAGTLITRDGVKTDEIREAGSYRITLDGSKNDIKPVLDGKELNGYTFDIVDATPTVEKRKITITSGSNTWEYDGKAHTEESVTVTLTNGEGEPWVGDDKLPKLTYTGSQKAIGTSANTFDKLSGKSWEDEFPNYEITLEYGTLEVTGKSTKWEITVVPDSFTTEYNGKEQSTDKNSFTVSGAVESSEEKSTVQSLGDFFTRTETKKFEIDGETYTITGLSAVGSGTDAGNYDIAIKGTETIKDSDGNDVTDQFILNKLTGNLEITKLNVTLSSVTLTKQYDGKALTNGDNELIQSGWLDGEGIDDVTFDASVTLPGEFVDNTFKYTLKNNTKLANYEIVEKPGTLSIVSRDAKYEIDLTPNGNSSADPNGGTFKYDGTEKSVSGFVGQEADGRIPVTADGKTYYVSGLSAGASLTDAGETTVSVSGTVKVTNEAGDDVTSEFAVKVGEATLKVTKREVVLNAASISKTYNGRALTNPEGELIIVTTSGITIDKQGSIGGDGWADGEGATYTLSGSRTIAGVTPNVLSYELNSNTKKDNYIITTHDGSLTVTNRDAKYEVEITGKTTTEPVYDGEDKSISGFVGETEDGVPVTIDGETYYVTGVTSEATEKDAGDHPTTIEGTPVVKDKDGNDVTDQFSVKVNPGTLTIHKAEVTLISADLSKTYDGKALTNGDTKLATESGWAIGEGADYTFTGSQTLVGFSANAFSYTLKSGTKESNYIINKSEGTLTVNNRAESDLLKVEVIAKGDEVVYDGAEHTASGFENETENGIKVSANGETYYVTGITSEAKGTDVNGEGTRTNITGTPIVKDEEGHDVTAQFDVVYRPATLKITKRDLILTSASLSKQYDGRPLTNGDTPMAEESGWVDGEGATYNYTGSRTTVGVTPNTFEIIPNEGTNLDNYNIKPTNGTLTVTSREAAYEVTIQGKSLSEKYDGKEHTVSGFENELEDGRVEVTVDGNTYYVSGMTSTKTGKNVADSGLTNVSGTPIVTDTQGNDVTDQFAVTVLPGNFEIGKRSITLTSEDRSKLYDGYPLTNGDGKVTIGGDGLAGNERLQFDFTGSQTLVGSSPNSFTYKFATIGGQTTDADTTGKAVTDDYTGIFGLTMVVHAADDEQEAITMGDLNNYDIQVIYGTLTVTARTSGDDGDDETVDPSKVVGKTHEDGIYAIGQTVDFTLTAKNIFADARNITFTELEGVTIDQAVFENVAPGATVSTLAHYTITEEDALAGIYKNVMTAAISDTLDPETNPDAQPGESYSAEDDVIPESPNASLSVVKKSDFDTAVRVGQTINYTVTVVNNGNVAVNDIEVTDELTGDTWTVAKLNAGASKDLEASYTVKESDVAEGKVTNVATATGEDGNGNKVESEGDTTDSVSQSFNLTIHYTDESGNTLAGDYTGTYKYKDSFYVQSPSVSGYTPKYSFVASDENGMPAKDVEVTVEYVKNPERLIPDDRKPDDNSGDTDGTDSDAGVTSDGTTSVTTTSTRVSNDRVAEAGVEPGGAYVTIADDGEAGLVSASDTETPLFNFDLGDHLCNILHFLLLLGVLLVVSLHSKRMKTHQHRIFELREKLDDLQK